MEKRPTIRRSNLDRSFEDKLRRAGESDITKSSIALFKSDLKFVSASSDHGDWSIHLFYGGKDERARDHAGAASERFVSTPRS